MEPQLTLLVINQNCFALVILVLSLTATIEIVTAEMDLGKPRNTDQIFRILNYVMGTSSSKARVVIFLQIVYITIGF